MTYCHIITGRSGNAGSHGPQEHFSSRVEKYPGPMSPRLSINVLEFFHGLPPCDFKLLGGKVPSVAVAYAPNSSADHPALLESVGGVLKGG